MRYLLALSFLMLAINSHAELFKWVDENGNTHYSDSPAPEGATSKIIENLPSANGYTSPEPTYQQQPSSKTVTMYSTSWCGYCKKARRYFQRKGITFNEYDIEKSSSAHRKFKQLGGSGVPLIVIGDQTMSGFNSARFESLYQQ